MMDVRQKKNQKSVRHAQQPRPDREVVFKRLAIRQCNRDSETESIGSLWNKVCSRAPKLPEAYEYIYGLVDPRNKLIRYVGRTKHPLIERLSQHVGTKERGESYKQQWIRGLILEGYPPLIIPICTVPADLAARIEKFVVWHLNHRFEPLVNAIAMKRYLRGLEMDVRRKLKCPISPSPPYHDHREVEIQQEVNKSIS